MYFSPVQRHTPKRNVLPLEPFRDDTARRQLARLTADLDELRREMQIQVTRSGQLQAELDEIKRLLKTLQPAQDK